MKNSRKRNLLLLTALILVNILAAQNEGVSRVGQLNIVKEVKPPILNIVPNSLEFVDATGNRAIDANETCKLKFQITNSGYGEGYGCEAKIKGVGTTQGVTFKSQRLNIIKVGATQTIEIPITSDMNTADGRIEFSVQVDEPNGMGTDPIVLAVETRAFEAPHIIVADYTITGTMSASLEKKKPFDLQILLQNTQYGLGENIVVDIVIPQNIMLLEGTEKTNVGTMNAGETKSLVYSLIANNNYSANSIPITFRIKEKYGKYAENKNLDLAFNQTFSTSKIEVDAVENQRKQITLASLGSDVDKNIPVNSADNTQTFAFIVANENYQNSNFSHVPFAKNDGMMFKEYCLKTLGLPEQNVRFYSDITYGGFKELVHRMKTTAEVNGKMNILFYYAGHGAPHESSKDAYLVPVDAYQVSDQICYNLQTLYDEMQQMKNAERITVFLDACFSGVSRNNSMLASVRGVAIKPKTNAIAGNMIVFSAASDDETAQPYNDQNHGLFTYFLLKKLKETQGEATYEEIYEYVYDNVRKISNNENEKIQSPSVAVSPILGESWKTWKLR